MEKEILEILKQIFIGASYTVFAVGVALFYTWPDATLKTIAAAFISTVALFICSVVCAQIKSRV